MVTLYEHPLSPYAQKVKIALREKGIEFEAAMPDILSGKDAALQAANPRLEVPALVDGETRVFDSTIILEYLEDKWPTPPLLPAAPAARARVRTLEELCDTYYEAINWGLYEVRVFKRAEGALAEAMIARAGEQIRNVNDYLNRALGDAEFFNGATFGWGDLSVFPAVAAAEFNGVAPAAGSALARWLERVRTRPSIAQTVAEGLESLAGFAMLPQLIAQGQFVREYRDHRLEWMLRSGGADIVLDGMRKGNIRFSIELA
jgi:glutathione S-transferase/RNA polymerase-associated protein